MARGESNTRIKIGHSLTGEYNGCRCNWYSKELVAGDAKRVAEQMGLKNIKTFPIWKDEKEKGNRT